MDDLIGRRFNKLVVLDLSNEKKSGRHKYYLCQCDCGQKKVIRRSHLIDGVTKGCGCGNTLNIKGKKFGRLIPIELVKRNMKYVWKCECECGNITYVPSTRLVHGGTKSCGCYAKERQRKSKTTHGMSHTKEHNTWVGIKKRCYNMNCRAYIDYGMRGIRVCDRWLNSFENFLNDMGACPSPDYSIERIDVNGNYEPDNCIWLLSELQSKNTRHNRWLSYNGEAKIMSDWATEIGWSSIKLYFKLKEKQFDVIMSGIDLSLQLNKINNKFTAA